MLIIELSVVFVGLQHLKPVCVLWFLLFGEKDLFCCLKTSSTESEWDAVMNTHKSRTDAVWTSDAAAERAKCVKI